MRRTLLPAAALLLPLAACGGVDPDRLRADLADVTAAPEAPVAADRGEGLEAETEEEGEERTVLEPFEVFSDVVDAEGSILGTAELRAGDRGTEVTIEVSGLPAGFHGLGLFAVGDCTTSEDGEAPYGSVGERLAPLPPLPVLENGSGLLTVLVDEAPTVDTLLLDDGTALVVGPAADDVTGAEAPSDGTGIACAAFGESELPEADADVGDEENDERPLGEADEPDDEEEPA